MIFFIYKKIQKQKKSCVTFLSDHLGVHLSGVNWYLSLLFDATT